MTKKIMLLCALFIVSLGFSQEYDAALKSFLNTNRSQLGLQSSDYEELKVVSHSFSKSMQLDNVYATQRINGIEVYNSNTSFAVKNNQVLSAKVSFTVNAAQKVNATNPLISALDAITRASSQLQVGSATNLQIEETLGANDFLFNTGGISSNNIPVKLVYQTMQDGALQLAWDLSIYLLDGSHYFSARIDALTGTLLQKDDWVISCDFGKGDHSHAAKNLESSVLFAENTTKMEVNSAGGNSYRVFGLPLESPSHGADFIVIDPSDAIASPFGWHDTNGAAGPEFTITRGNNVIARDDIDANNSGGFSPDGGASLTFDFPYNFNTDPNNVLDSAITNLFYWNNIMHDVWYQYGFDEASGNFQDNNYGNGGNASDFVDAQAQDGSGTNNANFATPPDGNNPRMQMYLWDPQGPAGDPLTINAGHPLTGGYTGASAGFGAPLPEDIAITSDLVLVLDNNAGDSVDENDSCDQITNGTDLNGKIVVIRRGGCEFGLKVLAAETQGAVAVIMVQNVNEAPFGMGGGDFGDQVTIPSIMVEQGFGENLITALSNGDTVNGTLLNAGPFRIDGDLDNGIIAHEYGHGISIRLTGGASTSGCLTNDEQMGEGWSDWFGLMLTQRSGDQSNTNRGIGTYAIGQPTDGQGIRNAPYNTDFGVNGFTYGNTNNTGQISQPHGIGFVWSTMLWDLNWALIDQYGYDPDLYNGTGGNNLAMQLVIDGLKLQGCSPGFVDGRNGILEADQLANDGVNECLIWEVFARRGLGFSATQGSPFSRTDQSEAFDLPSQCSLGNEDQGNLDNNFIVYPNPNDGLINIRTLQPAGDATISIFDINGRNVYNLDVLMQDILTINTQELTSGIYILTIEGQNYSHTTKLIVN
ncbi:T9SS-dependent M36 family metallopeptidase [Patiriisocius sp. Uisw_017]|jgi:hypothetical protein|uniref:T9SS-dependent M36 family metallopeptidase n=1 Tax=Patiriisocius sp. Uisw_017 TaxID=3230968 RepID=UPI0039EB7D22